MSIKDTFSPNRDGWNFKNWSETEPFSWDLFRRAYIGINPTKSIAAPLDRVFYEIFKNCAENGNCGGMSLLALALFKHGGWMGYCAPASFYSGTPSGKAPSRPDLYEAMNILQARQFSAPGIENFLDMLASENVNNAVNAFNTVKAHLANGDYCVLSIAKDLVGKAGHTIVPYFATEEGPMRYLYVWDSVTPFSEYHKHYSYGFNRVAIKSEYDWEYKQRDGYPDDNHFEGGPNAWCFAVPMSKVLRKARHPLAADMVVDATWTVFVSGAGAAVAQIEDDRGRRFYTTDADVHLNRSEFETDPARKLPNMARWPWFSRNGGELPGELYFARGPVARRTLKVTVTGRKPRFLLASARGLVEIEASASADSRDVIEIAGLGAANQGLRLTASNPRRRYDINQVVAAGGAQDWRGFKLEGLRPGKAGMELRATGHLRALDVLSRGVSQTFTASAQRFVNGELIREDIPDLRLSRTHPARILCRN